jgi:hypothetical protein
MQLEPARITLFCDPGTTFRLSAQVLLGGADGEPWDLSTASAKMQVRESEDGALVTELSTANGRISLDENGGVEAVLTAGETDGLPVGSWVYDLNLTEYGGDTYKLLRGRFVVRQEVTEHE